MARWYDPNYSWFLILSAGCGCQQWPLLWRGWEWWTIPHPGEILILFICCLVCIASCRVFQRRWRSWSLRMWWWSALPPTWPSMCSGTLRKRIRFCAPENTDRRSSICEFFRKKWKSLKFWIKRIWSTLRRGRPGSGTWVNETNLGHWATIGLPCDLSSVRPPILQFGCRETGEISYRCVLLINASADFQSFQESFQSSGRGRFGDQARTFCDHVFIFIRVTIQCLHAFISTPSLDSKHYVATNSCTLLVVINAPYHQWICNDIAHVVI